MMEYVGNVIYIEDLSLGGVYILESTVVTKEEALTPTGEVKSGYLEFKNVRGVVVCAREEFYRNKFGVVYKTDDGWYLRNSEAPWEMLPDNRPELWGTVVTMHLSYGSQEVYGEDVVHKVYFIE